MHVCDRRYLVKVKDCTLHKWTARAACVSFKGLLADCSFSTSPRVSVCLARLEPLLVLLLYDMCHTQGANLMGKE